MSKHTCSRRSFLRKGGIAAAGSTLFRGASEKAVDYAALVEKSIRNSSWWTKVQQNNAWLDDLLQGSGFASLDQALKSFLQAIPAKGWTYQAFIEAWGRAHMRVEFIVWIGGPSSLRSFAEYLSSGGF